MDNKLLNICHLKGEFKLSEQFLSNFMLAKNTGVEVFIKSTPAQRGEGYKNE